MTIPKYIKDILDRSAFVVGAYEPGYTIEIRKNTPYTRLSTFNTELDRLVKWCNKQANSDEIMTLLECDDACATIIRKPNKTRMDYQYAVVRIYDPVMWLLENYIKREVVY